MIMLVGR